MREIKEERRRLALRYGTNLPRPKKLKIAAPGFAIGSAESVLFSPCGNFLVANTANGAFLWDVTAGKKIARLKGISNPGYFSFSPSGDQLLMRNEVSEFARFHVPSGELIGRFSAKYELRLDGQPCMGPENETVLQLAYGGVFLALDARSGEVCFQRQMEQNTYSGAVYWIPESRELLVSQTSKSNWRNRCVPCAIWRWQWPLQDSEPHRIRGEWDSLETAFYSPGNALLLHSKRDGAFVLEYWPLDEPAPTLTSVCGGSIIPRPSVSHDRQRWAVSTDDDIEIGSKDTFIRLPIQNGNAEFHPLADLIAVSGRAGFVAPLSSLESLADELRLYSDERELKQRGYTRLSTLPNREVPPRIVVYAYSHRYVIQSEKRAGRHLFPILETHHFSVDADSKQASSVIGKAVERSTSGSEDISPVAERRYFLGSVITPPEDEAVSCVVVSVADDLIEIWPAKPKGASQFEHSYYPVAAIPADSSLETVWLSALEMLRWYRPRRKE